MKSIHTSKPFRSAFLIGASLLVGVAAQAASTFVTFSVDMSAQITGGTFTNGVDTIEAHGTFNGYGALVLNQVGSSTVYTNTANDTSDANGGQLQYKFVIDGSAWENPATGQNRSALLPTNSGASLVLPTAFYNDAGPTQTNNVTFQVDLAEQEQLGFVPNSTNVTVAGLFNGWNTTANPMTNDPTIHTTNAYGVVTTDVYVATLPVAGSPGGAEAFKYVLNNNGTTEWDAPNGVNSDGGGNRYYANAAQTLPIVYFSDVAPAPPVPVGFFVDMSAVALGDADYNPATYDIRLDGSFNGWGADVTCTNNPIGGNTNIWSVVVGIPSASAIQYQFRYTDHLGNTVYDNAPGGGNRLFTVPNVASTNLPVVYFNNVLPSDLLSMDTAVTFTLNMSNAVATPGSGDAGHQFDASSDTVFINGDFIGWLNWDPLSLSADQLAEVGVTSNYNITITFPKGHARQVTYKYGMNGIDDEAGFAQNHIRFIRSTNGTYAMPTDIFGTQTVEAKIGGLTIGSPSSGHLPVSWLPYPTALLQSSTDLNSGAWTDDSATLGQGSTNWPISGGNVFFRLKGQ
jgi:hypothetical protein